MSSPDMAFAALVAALTARSMDAGPQAEAPAQQRLLILVVPAMFTVLALWKMVAGVGLYWGVSSAFGIAQGLIVRRGVARERLA